MSLLFPPNNYIVLRIIRVVNHIILLFSKVVILFIIYDVEKYGEKVSKDKM